MKKFLIVTTVILLVFLSACSAAPAATEAAVTTANADTKAVTSSVLATDFTDAASLEQQLLAGTLQIEGTENAITTDQATQLLTLWQSIEPFGPGGGKGGPQGNGQPGSPDSQSTPAAPVDRSTPQAPADQTVNNVDSAAVLTQIEAVFTEAQLQAISAMQLTNAAITTYITDNNLSMQPGNGQGNPPAADGGNSQGGPQPDGTLQAPPNGQKPDMSSQVLLRAVIQLLQEKTGTTPQAN